MSGYTPVFDTVYDGTLCGKWPTLPVWLSILPMADKNGHIDLTYQAIAARTGWPLELLKQGIAELMAPDPESRTSECEGRRLELIDPTTRQWGWRVVNHGPYRNKARKAAYDTDRTASGADAQRKRDQREASRHVPMSPDTSRVIPPSDSDADTNSDSYAGKEKDMSGAAAPDDADTVFDHWRIAHTHPHAVLDMKRRRLILRSLKQFSAAQLCQSISGYLNSPHHMGRNKNNTRYDSIELLLRDVQHVEAGLRFFVEPPRTDLSDKTRRIIDQTENWVPPELRQPTCN